MHLTLLTAWSSSTGDRHLMNVNSNNIVTIGIFTNQTDIILVSDTH